MPIKMEIIGGKIVTYKVKFSDSFRFMHSGLSGLVDNLSEINIKDCSTCREKKY